MPPNRCIGVSMKRLLIMACSERKRLDSSPLPAIDRYDGPAFRVLRRYRRLRQDNGLAIYILSAEFGLIAAKEFIPAYDRRMTSKRADELGASVASAVQRAINRHEPSKIFICAGKTYLRTLTASSEDSRCLTVATGGQGEKLASLKAWLYERPV